MLGFDPKLQDESHNIIAVTKEFWEDPKLGPCRALWLARWT